MLENLASSLGLIRFFGGPFRVRPAAFAYPLPRFACVGEPPAATGRKLPKGLPAETERPPEASRRLIGFFGALGS